MASLIALQSEETCVLYWIYDGNLLSSTGNLDKNNLINLMFSTKIVNLLKIS